MGGFMQQNIYFCIPVVLVLIGCARLMFANDRKGFAFFLVLSALVFGWFYYSGLSEKTAVHSSSSSIENLDLSSININAPGCVIAGPDGKQMSFTAGAPKMIQKGSTISAECFNKIK